MKAAAIITQQLPHPSAIRESDGHEMEHVLCVRRRQNKGSPTTNHTIVNMPTVSDTLSVYCFVSFYPLDSNESIIN